MNKGFVLQEVGWEYNDNYYYRGEDKSGIPKKIFLDQKKAEDAVLTMTAVSFDGYVGYGGRWYGIQPLQYGDTDFDEATIATLNNKLVTILGPKFIKIDSKDYCDWCVPRDLTLEQGRAVAQILSEVAKIVFYEIVEVEIEN